MDFWLSFLKRIYLAELKGQVVAYLKAEIMEREPFIKKVGYVSETLVLPEFRGKGIGSKLLEQVLDWFRNNKLIWTTVSTHTNDSEANSFWEKNGYREYNKFFKKRL